MCDTMVRITDDGVLWAKNSDRDAVECQVLEHHPAADHEPGRLRATHADVDQVGHTHAVTLSRPDWMWGAEMGTNEHGVTIGNEAVFTRRRGDDADGELLGMDLLRLALERATDRHEAVGVIVALLEQHGQGGSCSRVHPSFSYDNSFLVADRDGATVLETAGRRWATEEVTGPARSISNALTIPGFAATHSDPLRSRVGRAATRRRCTQASAGRATSPRALMAALRDHGPDRGPHPAYAWLNGALSAPCAHAGGLLTQTQTTASWVADVTRGRHWATGTSAPCTSIFRPLPATGHVSSAAPTAPTAGDVQRQLARGTADLWRQHEPTHRRWIRDPDAWAGIARRRDELEASFVGDGVDVDEAWREASGWEAKAATVRPRRDTRPVPIQLLWQHYDRQSGVHP